MSKQKHFYLIRGLVRESGHWGCFPELIRQAYPDCLITQLDLPGAGEHHKSFAPISVPSMVKILKTKYQANPQEEKIIIGKSLGGMAAISWIKDYPQDFHHAILISTSVADVSPIHHRLLFQGGLKLLRASLIKDHELREKMILEVVLNNPKNFKMNHDIAVAVCKARPVNKLNIILQLMAASRLKIGSWKPQIPITILAGAHDRMVSPECSRALAKRWQAPYFEHPNAGHEVSDDEPEWVIEKIKERLI